MSLTLLLLALKVANFEANIRGVGGLETEEKESSIFDIIFGVSPETAVDEPDEEEEIKPLLSSKRTVILREFARENLLRSDSLIILLL
ncbi:12459_t:CDS:2 [Ambispora leptoticha]|uniref:12459_t:CDS:1 n=1 Tax=Ambispora leptoticha TaxID=144679 RepID=A0A9N9BGV2_9GLOM|nr:12459_t:CDS:2 [Ambispora leptoticha]